MFILNYPDYILSLINVSTKTVIFTMKTFLILGHKIVISVTRTFSGPNIFFKLWSLPFMGFFHLWGSSIYGVLPFMGFFHLWGSSIYGVLPFMGFFHLLGSSIYGVLPFIGFFHLWSSSIYISF